MIVANQGAGRDDMADENVDANGHRPAHILRVDFSERNATLVDLARACGDFDVRMDRLDVGDYCVDGSVVIERKTYVDFAMSLADGRLFPQAAALARSPHRRGATPLSARRVIANATAATHDRGRWLSSRSFTSGRRSSTWPPATVPATSVCSARSPAATITRTATSIC